MGDTTISWTDKTWNPGQGCSRVSEGCRNCYAERLAARFAENGWSQGLINLKTGKWNGVVRLAPQRLVEPISWRKPCRVFVNSMTDLFHEGFSNEEIAAVFGVIAACPQHTFQILTKRAQRMREWFEWITDRGDYWALRRCGDAAEINGAPVYVNRKRDGRSPWNDSRGVWPLPNVWLGVSVENQEAADERIHELLRTPAAIRFLSCEPLLGRVDLGRSLRRVLWTPDGRELVNTDPGVEHEAGVWRRPLDWVIAGCESGPGARPCDVAWLRSLRDQCAAAGVAFFLKQAVEYATTRAVYPSARAARVETVHIGQGKGSRRKGGGVIELPYLDDVQHAAFPEVASV